MPDNAIKLKLDAGFYKNGTEYQAAGRWADGDLVRWHNDNIKPINGWRIRTDFATNLRLAPLWTAVGEAARSGIALNDSLGGVNTYIGTNKKLYQVSNSNEVTDVTPPGFVAKPKHASTNTGYGTFRYSYGSYGDARPTLAIQTQMVFSWGFSSWGDWPVAVARAVDNRYVMIKRDIDAVFTQITTSPIGVNDVLVTDERFMMTFGTPADGRIIQWSDQEDFNTWAAAVDNQAGSLRVAGVGRLVRAVKVLGRVLVLGENDALSGQYVGPPYVYGFTRAGSSCGVVGPNAVVVTETFAAWMGTKSFWIFDGVARQLPCEVLDYVMAQIDQTQRSKTNAFTVTDYSECWWLYQSIYSETNEPDCYVIYNYEKQRWYTGKLDRTMGLDNDPLRHICMVSTQGLVYDHEIASAGRDGRVPYIETGPLELVNGERLLGCSYVFPDEKLAGMVRMELQVRDMPKQTDLLGPSKVMYSRDFALLRPTSTIGIMGRDIRMRLYSAQKNPSWVLGDFRVVPIKGVSPCR